MHATQEMHKVLKGVQMYRLPDNLIDLTEFRNREGIFVDRHHAGRRLADLLADQVASESVVLAIPAGGVPVACALAESLGLPLDVLVVSKITFPWNTEAGYGAVAQNGRVRLNDRVLASVRLNEEEIQEGIASTTAKVNRRVKAFRRVLPTLELREKPVILVDDGLASGTTLGAAMETAKEMAPTSIDVAVPTGHLASIRDIGADAGRIFCANVRSGPSFAVAAAYQHWSDVSESEAIELMVGRHRLP